MKTTIPKQMRLHIDIYGTPQKITPVHQVHWYLQCLMHMFDLKNLIENNVLYNADQQQNNKPKQPKKK